MRDKKRHIPDRVLRAMGYFSNFRGMMNRYLREHEYWDDHLQRTRKFISDAISQTGHNKVVVLGSGWLLDVPLEELSGQFEKVILVDIWHPAQVRHKMTKLPNVELKYMDLSGNTVMKAWEVASRNKKTETDLPGIEAIFPDPVQLPGGDSFYISANVLTQLDAQVRDFLVPKKIFPEEDLDEYSAMVQKQHLDHLKAQDACLISQVSELVINSNEQVGKHNPLLKTSLPEKEVKVRWTWKFDTQMTYYEGGKTHFEVVAIKFSKKEGFKF